MIVSVQFDLSKPDEAAKFAALVGPDVVETEPVTADSDLEFPLKQELPAPSVRDIQIRFKACQDKDAEGAKVLMRGFLDHCSAKAVKDLSDDDRLALVADLDDFLGGKVSPVVS